MPTPKASRETVLAAAYKQWQKDHPGKPLPEMFLVGTRAYFEKTMGGPGNDRGIYDDAIHVVSSLHFSGFQANTDPSVFRPGLASLLPGCHLYRPGNHGISKPGGGYPAFRPATPGEELPVRRDGEATVPSKRPGVAIDIHRGGRNGTSSLGCQTIHPDQWDAFYALVHLAMRQAKQTTFYYILIEGPIN